MPPSTRNCAVPPSTSPTARPSSTWSRLPTTSCAKNRRLTARSQRPTASPAAPSTSSTTSDAAVDYVAYLLETEGDVTTDNAPQLKGHDLIDNFLQQEQGRITLDLPQDDFDDSQQDSNADDSDEEYFTETLARIYIKQGRYQKALDIITRLSTKYPHKNAYFADQIRFLEKLIINNKNKTTKK